MVGVFSLVYLALKSTHPHASPSPHTREQEEHQHTHERHVLPIHPRLRQRDERQAGSSSSPAHHLGSIHLCRVAILCTTFDDHQPHHVRKLAVVGREGGKGMDKIIKHTVGRYA